MRNGRGGAGVLLGSLIKGAMMLFCASTWANWVALVGHRRRCEPCRDRRLERAVGEWSGEQIGGGNGVLDREINADTADW